MFIPLRTRKEWEMVTQRLFRLQEGKKCRKVCISYLVLSSLLCLGTCKRSMDLAYTMNSAFDSADIGPH